MGSISHPILPSPKNYYLLSTPRTCSSLLMRMLNLPQQPNIITREERGLQGYYFMPMMVMQADLQLRERRVEEWSVEERREVREGFGKGGLGMVELLEKGKQEGKNVYIKEHIFFLLDPILASSYNFGQESRLFPPFTSSPPPSPLPPPSHSPSPSISTATIPPSSNPTPFTISIPPTYQFNPSHPNSPLNPTILPDSLLKEFCPTILIRHPMLVFPSEYRAMRDVAKARGKKWDSRPLLHAMMTFRWARMLFEFYIKNPPALYTETENQVWPIVIEADDLISTPALLIHYAKLIGLDENKLLTSWPAKTEKEVKEMTNILQSRMTDTLLMSEGVRRDKMAKGLKMEEEVEKWKEEFGREDGEMVGRWCREAMEDYEWLRERRLRVPVKKEGGRGREGSEE